MSALGATFGKYFLTEKIATGGMAEIFLAKLIGPGGFEKHLIIKQIHPELSGSRQFVELFVAEAKTLVSLTHGNIVPIYELGMVDSTYFIAMEYIDGPTLAGLLAALRARGELLSPALTAYVCAELLKGLDYAHRKGEGVIHRDLSPRNVMISREGQVKLVDFGLAVTGSTRPSKGGRPAGSFPHMSPEQVRGENLDARSDLFAMGILLWEMLTGESLFVRPTDDETLAAVLEAPIPLPSELRPGIPAELDEVCRGALDRDLARRSSSAGVLLQQVHRYLYSQEHDAPAEALAKIVARTCPPTRESIRRRTWVEDELPSSGSDVEEHTSPMVDRTRPMVDRTPMAQGKPRAETTRTFATHAEFHEVLANATPLHAFPALTRDEVPDPEPDATARLPAASASRAAARAEPRSGERGLDPPSAPRARRGLTALTAALAALAGAGVAVVLLGQQTQATAVDAGVELKDAALVAPVVVADAAVARAPGRDAGLADGAVADARLARPKARPDAQTAEAGSLRVGANPWADVYLGKRHLGRAPGTFAVPAGHHTIELRFGEHRRNLEVDVRPGELTSLGVIDFDAP